MGSIMTIESRPDDRFKPKDAVGPRPGVEFVNKVAEAYRALGAGVEHELAVAGVQVDLLVREKTLSGNSLSWALSAKRIANPWMRMPCTALRRSLIS